MRNNAHGQIENSFLEPFLAKFRMRRIIKHLPNNCILCDIGCGFNADLLIDIQNNISRGYGFDIAVNNQLNNNRIILQKADLNQSIPLADTSVDIVTSLAVLEHLEDAEQNIKEIYRILKPGGILLLTTPTPISKPILEFFSYKLHLIDETEIQDHKKYYNKEIIIKLLTQNGFQINNIISKTWQFKLNNFVKAIK